MNVLVSGSSGLVGSALVSLLTADGHHVLRLVRPPARTDATAILWDPVAGTVDASRLEGIEAVVHLAGENIGAGRWTAMKKARLRDSRVKGTRLIAEAVAKLATPPRVLVCASAIGFYGDRGEEVLDENSPGAGLGFAAELCRERERAAEAALEKGIRVAFHRFGVVLSPKSGALAKIVPLFQKRLGGRVSHGRQYMSWIALDDAVGSLHHVLFHPELHGPVNAVAPNPVTNREFTNVLGRVLDRPTWFTKPAFLMRLALGEMADELLLGSIRVLPRRLLATGYRFRYPNLEDALRYLLDRPLSRG
jgi:uncharacterized protein (TIGR01777 family)